MGEIPEYIPGEAIPPPVRKAEGVMPDWMRENKKAEARQEANRILESMKYSLDVAVERANNPEEIVRLIGEFNRMLQNAICFGQGDEKLNPGREEILQTGLLGARILVDQSFVTRTQKSPDESDPRSIENLKKLFSSKIK